MTVIHIFNPSHEMAMAHASTYYQPRLRIAQMEEQLALLPVWWSHDGDSVLVSDEVQAHNWMKLLPKELHLPDVQLLDLTSISQLNDYSWEVWGWNELLARQLKGLKNVPSADFIDQVRRLSSRQVAVEVLASFPEDETLVGESYYCTTPEQVFEVMEKCPSFVLKSLWSSSGRGVMMQQLATSENSRELCLRFLQRGGGLVIEPQYDKVQDLAMEFWSDGKGKVTFAGYSVFWVDHGRYGANIVATQSSIVRSLSVDISTLEKAKLHLERVLSEKLGKVYQGPLGVDMMVVKDEGRLRLHPCVEINLRRNMGWVALTLAQNFLAPNAQGRLYTDYVKGGSLWQDHQNRLTAQPLSLESGKIRSGYLALTQVTPLSEYRIRLEVI